MSKMSGMSGALDMSEAKASESSSSSSLFVNVYVNGDGIDWSCTNSQLFRIPTELFDYYMLIGQLETREDLQKIIDKVASANISCPEDAYTNVYVQSNGAWSGIPSSARIP